MAGVGVILLTRLVAQAEFIPTWSGACARVESGKTFTMSGYVDDWRVRVAMTEEAAGGEEFGVEKSSTGGAADEIVREQREFDPEERAGADAADDNGHAAAGQNIAARLGAIFFVEHENGAAQRGVGKTRAIPVAKQLARLGFHFFFFASDEGNDVGAAIERGDAGIARSGEGLQ